MTSNQLGPQSLSTSNSGKNKTSHNKIPSFNGDPALKTPDNRRNRNYTSSKTIVLQQDRIPEDGVDGKRGFQKTGTILLPNQMKEDIQPVNKNLDLPEVFEKYVLTTDVPFTGIRTTKAKIEPIKPIEVIPNALSILKASEDAANLKKLKLMKTNSKLLPPDPKAIAGSESKPSLDRSVRRNKEKDSQGTLESKQGSPSKNSFDFESDSKERPAFITEALQTPNMNAVKREPSREFFDFMQHPGLEADLNQSLHSEEKSKERTNKFEKGAIKRLQIEKQQYDPWLILNQLKTKRQEQETTGRHGQVENKITQRTISPDINQFSTPRDFTVLRSRKMNLFEGIPYVPYDIFLRQDPNMQNVIIRDLLKVLMDKGKSLQNLFRDNYRIDKILKNIEEPEQSALNLHLEETIGLINAIASLVLQEFKDSIDKIGIKPSPIFDNPDLKISGFGSEIERFYDNSRIFLETMDHLRDCIDCYNVMTRQRDRKPMPDFDCSNLLQFIARSRYNLGQLYEAFRVIEKHVDGKLGWKSENNPEKAKEIKNKSLTNRTKTKGDNHKSLNELLQQKFNINKNKLLTTRESKVVLNQEAEDEKFLRVLQNQKQLTKKKGAHDIGDSRKLIILNRILNPLEDPEVQIAIKLAKEKTNVQLGKDILESIGSKTKSVDPKSRPNIELPLIKNTLQKIFTNKNLAHMCFDINDPKKYDDIMENLSSRNKNNAVKEIVNDVMSHSKTHRHLGCLFDGEALNQTARHEGLKLPQLPKAVNKLPTQTR